MRSLLLRLLIKNFPFYPVFLKRIIFHIFLIVHLSSFYYRLYLHFVFLFFFFFNMIVNRWLNKFIDEMILSKWNGCTIEQRNSVVCLLSVKYFAYGYTDVRRVCFSRSECAFLGPWEMRVLYVSTGAIVGYFLMHFCPAIIVVAFLRREVLFSACFPQTKQAEERNKNVLAVKNR